MGCESKLAKPYSTGPYNKYNVKEQWVRLSEGCPNNCPYCNEPQNYIIYPFPEIVCRKVKIIDMNLLCKPEAKVIIKKLADISGTTYELVCGIDYRFMDQETANLLKASRFKNIRLAWDWQFTKQKQIKNTINMLLKAGYTSKSITIFIICNWKIPYLECLQKLDLCKVWNVKVADCWFDNQLSPNIKPIHWDIDQIKSFRRKCRKHNQLVNFGIDPEVK